MRIYNYGQNTAFLFIPIMLQLG